MKLHWELNNTWQPILTFILNTLDLTFINNLYAQVNLVLLVMVNGLTIMVMGEIKTSKKLFISLPGRNTIIPPSLVRASPMFPDILSREKKWRMRRKKQMKTRRSRIKVTSWGRLVTWSFIIQNNSNLCYIFAPKKIRKLSKARRKKFTMFLLTHFSVLAEC